MKKCLTLMLCCSIALTTHADAEDTIKQFLRLAGINSFQIIPSKDTERLKKETWKGVKELFQAMQSDKTDEMISHQCTLTRIILLYVMLGLPDGKAPTFQEAVEYIQQHENDLTRHSWLIFNQQKDGMRLSTLQLGVLTTFKHEIKNGKLNEQDLKSAHQKLFDETLQEQQKLGAETQEKQAKEFQAFNAAAFEALNQMDTRKQPRDFSPEGAY